jgi:hypothetical protein
MNHSSLVLGCGAAMLVACGGGTSKVSGATTLPEGGDDDAAADGGGQDAADERIDPLEVGRSWTYEITELGTYPLCPGGVHTGAALMAATVDGKQAIEVQSACANVGSAYYAVDGDLVQVAVDGAWLTALAAPVQEGQTWSEGSESFTWHSAGTVTVPAGTFSECWSATQNVAYSAYAIFCRGVGPVRWYTKDAQGDGYDAQLSAKNF